MIYRILMSFLALASIVGLGPFCHGGFAADEIAALDNPAGYSLMSSEDASKLVKTVISEVPKPTRSSAWLAPEAPSAVGVRIGRTGNQFLVFAPVESKYLDCPDPMNLYEFVPAVNDLLKKQEAYCLFWHQTGVFYSTADLEILSRTVLEEVTRRNQKGDPYGWWSKGTAVLPKGGYIWKTAEIGIVLEGRSGRRLILFDKPQEELGKSFLQFPVYRLTFDIADGKVEVPVAGEKLSLKAVVQQR